MEGYLLLVPHMETVGRFKSFYIGKNIFNVFQVIFSHQLNLPEQL